MKNHILITWFTILFLIMNTATAVNIEISPSILGCVVISENMCKLKENIINISLDSNEDGKYVKAEIEGIDGYFLGCENTNSYTTCYFHVYPFVRINNTGHRPLEIYIHSYGEKPFRIVKDIVINPIRAEEQKVSYKIQQNPDIHPLFITLGICSLPGEKIDKISLAAKISPLVNFIATETLPLPDFVEDSADYTKKLAGVLGFKYTDLSKVFYIGRSLSNFYSSTSLTENLCNCPDCTTDILEATIDYLFATFSIKGALNKLYNSEIMDTLGILTHSLSRLVEITGDPEMSYISISVDGYPLIDGMDICGNGFIDIDYKNIDDVVLPTITVEGTGTNGRCSTKHNIKTISTISVKEFLCGVSDEPVDGGKYKIVIETIDGYNITYNVTYYKNMNTCYISTGVFSVD